MGNTASHSSRTARGTVPELGISAPGREVERGPELHARGRVGEPRKEPHLRPFQPGKVGHRDAAAKKNIADLGLERCRAVKHICSRRGEVWVAA